MYDLAVIGAGPGGYEAAAFAAGTYGKNVILFEKEKLGGTCLNKGCIPTKTLLRSAKAFSDCREAELYGVNTGSPEFNMGKVQERKRNLVDTLLGGVGKMLKAKGVEVVNEAAELIGDGKIKAGDKTYEAQNILIATGSVPAIPPITGMDSENVLDSTAILELEDVPKSLAVIGGGVIGLEFACFFAELGTEVTVVEMLPKIAPVIDEDIAKRLMQSMKKQGVKFNLSSKVTEIKDGNLLFTDKKGKGQQLDAQYILCAVGRAPVLDGIGLDTVGVDYDKRGIKVDDKGQTNIPGIRACGDVTGRCLLAHSATREGQVAVNNMFGKEDSMRFNAMPSVIYTHPEVASVGPTEDQLKEQGIEYKKITMPMAVAGRFMVEYQGKSGTVKVMVGEKYGEILAVHMIGGICGEFIASAAAMIEMEMRVDDVREIIFPHPTCSEALKETIVHL